MGHCILLYPFNLLYYFLVSYCSMEKVFDTALKIFLFFIFSLVAGMAQKMGDKSKEIQ